MPRSCPRRRQLIREISQLAKAVARLIESGTPEQIIAHRHSAEILRGLAQKAKLGWQQQNECAEARLRLERRFYKIVHPLIHRGRPPKNVPSEDIIDGAMQARLEDWGVSRNLFSRMRQIAAVPKPVFERFFVQAWQQEWEI